MPLMSVRSGRITYREKPNFGHHDLGFLLYRNVTVATGVNAPKLLDRLESAYSLILGTHHIWGRGGGETLPL